MRWYIYYIINEMRICIAEFQFMIDAYNWLKDKCKEKQDGYYFNDLPVVCEYR